MLGAIFVVMIDPFLTYLKDDMPGVIAGVAATLGAGKRPRRAHPGCGRSLCLRQRAEGRDLRPDHRAVRSCSSRSGIYGRWLKIKLFFQLFPLYKRATFKRQKSYMRSERLR